jgi:hypothetical protein
LRSRLEQLSKSEIEAENRIKDALKKAREIHLSIPDEKLSIEKIMLKKIHQERMEREKQIEIKIAGIKKNLDRQTKSKIKDLQASRKKLIHKAKNLLKNTIIGEEF